MTPQDLVSFVKLVGKMYQLQQRFFSGDATAFIQAKVLECKVDKVIANYNRKLPKYGSTGLLLWWTKPAWRKKNISKPRTI